MNKFFDTKQIIDKSDILQIIEINIGGAGQLVSFETQSLTGMKDIIGIALINPNPLTAGHGTLRLRVGDTEILPNGFHADIISKFNPKEISTKVDFAFKDYIFPAKVEAKGKPVKIDYTEPQDGSNGKLHLYLLGVKGCCNLQIPKHRFQIIQIDVPQGGNTNDIEIPIDEKTILSHNKVKGVFLVGVSNRIKKLRLCIDGNSVLPDGFQAQLVTKELVSNSSINGSSGIFTKHIIPVSNLIYLTDQKAKNSEIEGSLWAVPSPSVAYKMYLYLIAEL